MQFFALVGAACLKTAHHKTTVLLPDVGLKEARVQRLRAIGRIGRLVFRPQCEEDELSCRRLDGVIRRQSRGRVAGRAQIGKGERHFGAIENPARPAGPEPRVGWRIG